MVRNLRKSRKGAYFFVLDALIGILIFATTVFIIAGFNTFKPSTGALSQQLDLLSADLYETELRNVDITSDFFIDLKQNHPLYDPYITVDEFVYFLVLSNEVNQASLLVGNLTSWLVPSYGINYSITYGSNIVTIFYRNSTITTYEDSRSSLAREKVTVLGSNMTHFIEPGFSSVAIWR